MDHRLRLFQAHDGVAQMVLQPHPDERQGLHHVQGQRSR